jgi:hypothetical protein
MRQVSRACIVSGHPAGGRDSPEQGERGDRRSATQIPMDVHWYAESPARRSRQLLADAAVALALLACVWVGLTVHHLTADLAAPGRTLESAGAALADTMDDAGAAAGKVPLAGQELAAPFSGAGQASRAIEAAGVRQQQVVARMAALFGLLSGAVPALVILSLWLPRRVRFAREAGLAGRLRDAHGGLDILALRALARQPLGDLERVGPAVVDGWRAGDPQAIEALAALELRCLGLAALPPGPAER